MWQIWLIIAGFCIIVEILTVGFLVFWFAIGALFAMITSFFTDNIIIQTSVFLITSTILIFATKPFVKKFASTNLVKTNAYSIIGKKAIVIEDIDNINSTGQIKINGEIWSAKTVNDTVIPKGSEVEILEIKGVKVIVSPLKISTK